MYNSQCHEKASNTANWSPAGGREVEKRGVHGCGWTLRSSLYLRNMIPFKTIDKNYLTSYLLIFKIGKRKKLPTLLILFFSLPHELMESKLSLDIVLDV